MPWFEVGYCSEADPVEELDNCKKGQKMTCWCDEGCLSGIIKYAPYIYP